MSNYIMLKETSIKGKKKDEVYYTLCIIITISPHSSFVNPFLNIMAPYNTASSYSNVAIIFHLIFRITDYGPPQV